MRALLGAVAKDRGGVTADRLRALLSKLFRWAVSQDYLPANPASELPKLARETSRSRVLSDDELRALWARLEAAEKDEKPCPHRGALASLAAADGPAWRQRHQDAVGPRGSRLCGVGNPGRRHEGRE